MMLSSAVRSPADVVVVLCEVTVTPAVTGVVLRPVHGVVVRELDKNRQSECDKNKIAAAVEERAVGGVLRGQRRDLVAYIGPVGQHLRLYEGGNRRTKKKKWSVLRHKLGVDT